MRPPRSPLVTECVSWRWNGNLGDDMIWAAQEEMFAGHLQLEQWADQPEALLIGGGTWIPKVPMRPDLADLAGAVPTAVFATGVDDPRFWGRESIPQWRSILERAGFVGVRGPLSVAWLDEMGFDVSTVSWIGDAALHYFVEPDRPVRPTGRIAINVGTTFGRLYGDSEQAVIDQVIEAVRSLHTSGWKISLVCTWQPDDDALTQVANAVPIESTHHWHDDWRLALAEVAEFDVVVAMKLHAAVVAACRSVPFVALSYRSKVLDFAASIGSEDNALSTENLRAGDILERVAEVSSDLEKSREVLVSGVESARHRLRRGAAAVQEVMKS